MKPPAKPLLLLLSLGGLLSSGCQPTQRTAEIKPTPTLKVGEENVSSESRVTPETEAAHWNFTDITEETGIQFRHVSGAQGLQFLPETMGSGVAVFDWDNDGWQDIYFVNSRHWTMAELLAYKNGQWNNAERAWFVKKYPGKPFSRNVPMSVTNSKPTGALYRNDGKGKFINVTAQANLNFSFYGMGAYPADYDGDGRTDLFLTGLGRCYLLRNENGRFRDVTPQSGLNVTGWATCALWLDHDKDGDLDLFVGRYAKWTPATDVFVSADKKKKTMSAPELYEGETALLFRNDGGQFTDISFPAGVSNKVEKNGLTHLLSGRMLGAVMCDFNNDNWPDIIVANDGGRNFLLRNDKGVFVEQGHEAGLIANEEKPRASRGIDTGDYNNTNYDSVVVTNSPLQMMGLFQNLGKGLFSDVAPVVGLGEGSRDFLGFGVEFVDLDNDGWLDIFAANGHIYPQDRIRPASVPRLQRPLIFRNLDGVSFEEIGTQCGPALNKGYLARGLARADFDRDGDLDMVITTNNGAPVLLRNNSGNLHNSVRLELRGQGGNRDALGALLKIRANGQTLRRWVRSGSSYLSQSETAVTIGLDEAEQVDEIGIFWPASQSKKPVRVDRIAANQRVIIQEGRGIVALQPLVRNKEAQFPKSPKRELH